MSYKRNNKLKELSKAKIRDTRNAIINEMIGYDGESKGFLISQQVEFKEDGQTTRMFLRGGMTVSNVDGLISLRKALDKAIVKAGGEVPERTEADEPKKGRAPENKGSKEEAAAEDSEIDVESIFGEVPDVNDLEDIDDEEGEEEGSQETDGGESEEREDSEENEDAEKEAEEGAEESEIEDEWGDDEGEDSEEVSDESEEVESDYDIGGDEEWES